MPFIIKRVLLNRIREHLSVKEITLITGARQVGKTTLMEALQDELKRMGKKTLWLSLDFEEDKRLFSSQLALIQRLDLEFGRNHAYVFIDEIQRKENAGLFLKGIYDRKLPYKFIVSGSGSLELKEKIHESLVGRKRQFDLSTVSFDEFVHYKTEYKYGSKLQSFFRIEKEKTRILLSEYMRFGGYPAVLLAPTTQEKRSAINEIFRSYIEKDISYLLNVEKVQSFSDMIRVLSDQVGKLLNYSELAATLSLSQPTVRNYLWYAEKTYILTRLRPYFKNKRKEITKSPVPYFHDLGLRNYSAGVFSNVTEDQFGYVFQNFVFLLLQPCVEQGGGSLHFWRTLDKAEVDFVLRIGKKTIPVEVKYSSLRKAVVGRSLRNFIEKYHPERAWVVCPFFRDTISINKTTVEMIPFYLLQDRAFLKSSIPGVP